MNVKIEIKKHKIEEFYYKINIFKAMGLNGLF